MSDYIKEFNDGIRKNYENISEESLKYLGMITTTNDYLSLEKPEVTTFFINLHRLLEQTQSLLVVNHCMTILENSVKYKRLRNSLITDYRFVPVLAQILYRFSGKNLRVLKLLEEMTYDITTNHDIYLDELMQHLLKLIRQKSDISELAFAIIVNLCFKNEECKYLVVRMIKIKELAKLVDSFGIYTWKFYLIFDNEPDTRMRSGQMKLCLNEMEKALEENNYKRLRHVVDYINRARFLAAEQKCETSLKQKIIDRISAFRDTAADDEASEEKRMCIDLLFSLLVHILQMSDYDEQSITSLVDISLTWLTDDLTTIGAMKVLAIIFKKKEVKLNEEVVEDFKNQVSLIVQRIDSKKISYDGIIVFFEMLLRMIEHQVVRNIVVSTVSGAFLAEFIKEISEPVSTVDTSTYFRLYVHAVYILNELSNIDRQQYHGKFRSLMQTQETQKLLAQAFCIRDVTINEMLFYMIRSSEFPIKEVSELLARQDFICPVVSSSNVSIPKVCYAPPTVELENRLEEILAKLNKYPQNDLLATEIIEAYKYNIDSHLHKTENLTMRLKNAESTISSLSHETQLLNTQLAKYQQDQFAKLFNYETIKKEKQILETELSTLRNSIHQFSQSYDAAKKQISQLNKHLEEKEEKLILIKEQFQQFVNTHEDKLKASKKECATLKESENALKKETVRLNDFVKALEKQIKIKDEEIKSYKDELEECDEMRQMIANVVSKRQKK